MSRHYTAYMEVTFKQQHSYRDRCDESSRILSKFPYRVPVVCEKHMSPHRHTPTLDKKKYLVPRELTMGQFVYVIRKRMKLPPEEAIFLCIGSTISPSGAYIGNMYDQYGDVDGFLYITYTTENTFG